MSARTQFMGDVEESLAAYKRLVTWMPAEHHESLRNTFLSMSMWLSDTNDTGWCDEALKQWRVRA
jgi:hypothetical protein